MKRHSQSCSCTSCAYRSYSKRPSIQNLIDEGTRIDRLFYGKYLPLRERKLLEKLIRTRAIYDDVRDQLLSPSGSSDRARSEYTFRSQGDDSMARSSTVSKLVSLVDRGQIRSSNAILSSCCNCCSCSSIKRLKEHMKKHPPKYKKPDIPYENIAKYKLKAEKQAKSRRKRIGSKIKDVRFKSRSIYSEACLCTKSLTDTVKRSSKALKTKLKSKENATISHESSGTEAGSESKRKPLPKGKKHKKSIGLDAPKRFPIKKDSLSLYRDKMRRKHARKRTKDKGLEACDPDTCKYKRDKHKKKHDKGALVCEPGICEPDECEPEKCLEINEKIQKNQALEDWECEPGVCVPDECDPEVCYKKIIARRGGNIKKKKGRNKITGAPKANSSIYTKPVSKLTTSTTETKLKRTKSTMPKKAIKHSSSQSRTSHSSRSQQIEHTLKRCFCTLKLQKRKPNLKRSKSKKTMASLSVESSDKIGRMRKTQTKSAGITYKVPPMGPPLRHLLPYECEPFVCVPGECDPYVCEKRIQARYQNEVQEEGNQISSKIVRTDTKGIKVHKPRVRYTRSQTVKTEKTKQTHTKPFLQRCFCTLKLFNKNISKKKASTVTSVRKPPKPYKTKPRDKYSETTISSKSSNSKKMKSDMSSEALQAESHATENKLTKKTDYHPKRTDKVNIVPSPSDKQAVRIGSSFSFNIEFYKEKIPINSDKAVVKATKFKREHLPDKSISIHGKKRSRKAALKTRGSQQSNTNVKEKGIFVGAATPTCFCSLKLQKKGKHSKTGQQSYETSRGTDTTLELYSPKQNSDYKSTSTSKSLRYDIKSFCVPATCDPYESYEEMKRRAIKLYRDRNIATEKKKRKSTMSMTYNRLSGNFKARNAQSYVSEHVPDKRNIKHRRGRSRQAVCIGSNFSFSIDIYKDRSASNTRDKIISKGHNETKNKQESLEFQRPQTSSIIEKEDRTFNVGHKLKRCFCTLKFQKKESFRKMKGSNYQWLTPITAQFMHVLQRNQCDEPDSNRLKDSHSINNEYYLTSTVNETEKHCKEITLKQDFQNNSNSLESKININKNNLIKSNSTERISHFASHIQFNLESSANRNSTSKFEQYNEYEVGHLNGNQTQKISNQFYRSYYALNVKVSQPAKCNPANCKFLNRLKYSKQVGTDSIQTRDGMSSTRHKTHGTGMATGTPRSQRFNNRRDSKDNKKGYFDPGKRVTHIGSSINYNLKFYKDTNSKVHVPVKPRMPQVQSGRSSMLQKYLGRENKRRNTMNPYGRVRPQKRTQNRQRILKEDPMSFDRENDMMRPSRIAPLLRKCICSLGMGNRGRSVARLENRRMATNPSSNSTISKNRVMLMDNTKSKHNKRRLDDCDPQECVKIKRRMLRKSPEKSSAGDYVNDARKLNTRNAISSNKQLVSKDKMKLQQYKRLLDECDPQECVKIMHQVLKKTRLQDSAGDYERKRRFTTIRKDPYSARNMNMSKSQVVMKDNNNKRAQYKRQLGECDPEECRKILQQVLSDHKMYRKQKISNAEESYNNDKSNSRDRDGKLMMMTRMKLGQYKDVAECDPQECGRKLDQAARRRRQQSSGGDNIPDISRRNRFRSIRTDRSTRVARENYNPEIPTELEKIMIKPPKSDIVKYGSKLSINLEFFKDTCLNIDADSASPDTNEQIDSETRRLRKKQYGENESADYLNNRVSVRSVKTDTRRQDELSTVSQMLRKCVCSLKALNKDRKKSSVQADLTDVPHEDDVVKDDHDDAASSVTATTKLGDKNHICKCKLKHHTCKCKLPNHKCKCKLEHHTCKCKLEHHTCKCKLEHHTCKCKLPHHKCKCGNKKNTCVCGTEDEESEVVEPDKKSTKKSIRFQDEMLEDVDKRPDDSFMRKCFCKLRLLQDRKSLELKPSVATIPSAYKRNGFGASMKRRLSRKSSYEHSPFVSDQSTDMDTIMAYSKRRFRRQSSKSRVSKKSPCNVCPIGVCPACGQGNNEIYEANGTINPLINVNQTQNVSQINTKPTKKGQAEEEESTKKKEICIKIPNCNIKNIFDYVRKFKSNRDELEQLRAGQLEPLFEMIVDSQTMSVRNKDDIIRDLLSGRIQTTNYNYNDAPHDNTLNQGLTLEKGHVAAPVMGFVMNKNNAVMQQNIGGLHIGKKRGKLAASPGEPPEMHGMPPMTPGKPPSKLHKLRIKPLGKTKYAKPNHPRGCLCCDCRHGAKKKKKEETKAEKGKPKKKRGRNKPCVCGSSICKQETAKMKTMTDLDLSSMKVKTCICGSEVCKHRAKTEQSDLKLYLRKKRKEELEKIHERRRRLESYKKEDHKIHKERKKRDKKAIQQIQIQSKANDFVLLAENIADLIKFGSMHTCGFLRSTFRSVAHPGDAWFRFKRGIKEPGKAVGNIMDILFKHSGIHSLAARIKARTAAMRSTKILVAEMEMHPVTNVLLHVGDKKKTHREVRRPKTPIDFNCSPFMGSLRQKPCLWIYYLCPWFYPHCIGCIGMWRQFTDILLFILAIGVWSPCILAMEVVRGLMCCLVCTG